MFFKMEKYNSVSENYMSHFDMSGFDEVREEKELANLL